MRRAPPARRHTSRAAHPRTRPRHPPCRSRRRAGSRLPRADRARLDRSGPCSQRRATAAGRQRLPVSSRYCLIGSTAITTPGRLSASSPMSSAASRLTPRSIGTRSNGEPRKASSRARSVARSAPVSSARREMTRPRSALGRSAGRTLTVHDGMLTAIGRPARSKISPRGAGIGTSSVRSAAARSA